MSGVTDIIVISIILFSVGVALLVTVYVGHTVIADLKVQSSFNSSSQAVSVLNNSNTAINYTDYDYLGGFIGFFIMLIVTGYFVVGYPILSVIYYIVLILFGFISVILQNVWIYIISQPAFSSTSTTIPITNYIMMHLAYFMVAFGLIAMVVTYAKAQ